MLGMHRSGTSAITRGLSVLGVDLGDRLMPPAEGNNAKGFWEDIDLNALNIDMLRCLGRDWSHMAMVTAAEVERLRQQGFFLRAVELMRNKMSDSAYFGCKDPRVVKLLPFWREVFNYCGFDVSYVFAIRNPLSVARSLGKRDGMESEHSYLLWLAHVVAGLANCGDHPCIVVDYDRVMQAPEDELTRMAKALQLELDGAALRSYKEDFLDDNLRHTVYVAADLLIDQSCPPLLHEIYETLLEVACDRRALQEAAMQAKIEQWLKQFDALQVPLCLGDKLLARNAALEERLRAALRASEDSLARNAALEERLRAEQGASADSLAQRQLLLGEREARLAELEEQLKSFMLQAGQWEGRAQELSAQHAERSVQLHAANLALAERDKQLSDCMSRLATLREEMSWRDETAVAAWNALHS